MLLRDGRLWILPMDMFKLSICRNVIFIIMDISTIIDILITIALPIVIDISIIFKTPIIIRYINTY